jgi:hypothetical protein
LNAKQTAATVVENLVLDLGEKQTCGVPQLVKK